MKEFAAWLESEDMETVDDAEFTKRLDKWLNGLLSVKDEDMEHLGREVYSQQIADASSAVR